MAVILEANGDVPATDPAHDWPRFSRSELPQMSLHSGSSERGASKIRLPHAPGSSEEADGSSLAKWVGVCRTYSSAAR